MNFLKLRKISHLEKLQDLFAKIDQFSDSARNLFRQSEQLKQLVSRQKQALEQSSSASHEIFSMVARTAEAANELSNLAIQSHRAVESSSEALRDLTELISGVNKSSQGLQHSVKSGLSEISSVTETMSKIRDKAKIINEIVFQTKLLSFNASVEAARAGEHGRGFAVVAEEMGNLARASGNAAQEIEKILISSVDKTKLQIDSVTRGLESAATETITAISSVATKSQEIASSFSKLESYSKSTQEKAKEISLATKEQEIGIEEISKSLEQLELSSDQVDSMAISSNSDSANLAAAIEVIITQFAEIAKNLGYHLVKVEKPFDFDAAISAHIDWKMKLSKYLQNPDGSLDPSKICLDNMCALGKWIYGDGAKHRDFNIDSFDSLKSSHAKFHETASEIVRLINEGKRANAEKMLGPSGLYLSISEQTVALIKELRDSSLEKVA